MASASPAKAEIAHLPRYSTEWHQAAYAVWGTAMPLPLVSQFKLPLQLDTGSFKSVLDVVFDDALASDDLCTPIGEVGLCSKDTDIEVIDDRTVLLLERGSQHAFELFGRLLKFVHA